MANDSPEASPPVTIPETPPGFDIPSSSDGEIQFDDSLLGADDVVPSDVRVDEASRTEAPAPSPSVQAPRIPEAAPPEQQTPAVPPKGQEATIPPTDAKADVQQPTAAQPEPDSPATPASLYSQLEQNREVLIDALAEQRFKLSPEQIKEIEEGDVATVLPKLLSRIYLDATQSALHMIQQTVPDMVMGVYEARVQNQERKAEFYKEFPDLERHEKEVVRLAETLRNNHPQMPGPEFRALLGRTARAYLNLSAPAPAGNGRTGAPRMAHAPIVSSVPAAGGSAAPAPSSPFDGLWIGAEEEG